MSPVPALCGTLLHHGALALDTPHGRFTAHRFTDLVARQPLLALTRGECRGPEPLLARIHSACVTGESMGSADCDCAEQLDTALARIAAAGRGAIFYLLQEGRGAGLVAKARDRMLVQASGDQVTTFDAYARLGLDRDYRRYDGVAFAAAALGLTAPLHLLSNNPDKLAALRNAGVAIADCAPLAPAPSAFNLAYLAAKSSSGHALDVAAAPAAAALPEPVALLEPAPLPELPALLRVASYLLPVSAPAPTAGACWMRLPLYVERDGGRERVVFTVPRRRDVAPIAHVHAETLLGRFPGPGRAAAWRAAVARLAARGAGAALFLLHDEPHLETPDRAADHVAAHPYLARLLALHLQRPAELLTPHAALAATTSAQVCRRRSSACARLSQAEDLRLQACACATSLRPCRPRVLFASWRRACRRRPICCAPRHSRRFRACRSSRPRRAPSSPPASAARPRTRACSPTCWPTAPVSRRASFRPAPSWPTAPTGATR
ncbi:MAG: hypothetical protein U0802_07610 [Candidatus Binatia bacterium]